MKTFLASCVGWPCDDVPALCAMIDSGRTITRRTFLRHVDRISLAHAERALGYPFGRLTMAADWAVSYHKGTLHGAPVVWFRHSAIEYVFAHNQTGT